MKNKKLWLVILAIAFVFGMAIVGCDDNSSSGGDEKPEGPPPSVDAYSNLEPRMAANPSRAVARTGETTSIGIPDYLLPASSSVRAAVNATFAVHEDDVTIAKIVSQNGTTCTVKGLQLGSARIIVTVGGLSATVIIAVAPSEPLYRLPAAQVKKVGDTTFKKAWWNTNQPDNLPSDYESYNSEPTYQLAWNWRNPTQSYGLTSGKPCGIDLLAYFVDPSVNGLRGWVRTTYDFGGWHYDLNGVTNSMTNGVQTGENVKLELKPEFIYDNGIPYLELTHTLTNTGNTSLKDQKFGASADVMLYDNDRAPLTYLQYGALMTNEYTYWGTTYLPTVKLRLVCQNVQGIDNVTTLWMGTFGSERRFVYEDSRESITAEDNEDTAFNFSYQNINLEPGEVKKFVVRFTQVQ